MMDEISYNLLLKGTQGLTLLGTLRYSLTFSDAVTRFGDTAALIEEALQRPVVELFVIQAQGTLSVPLITGPTPVPLTGLAFGGVAGVITVLFSTSDETRSLSLQINPIDATHIGGGLNWQPGQPGNLIFSVLGTQLTLGM
jgi:hypothetical protein